MTEIIKFLDDHILKIMASVCVGVIAVVFGVNFAFVLVIGVYLVFTTFMFWLISCAGGENLIGPWLVISFFYWVLFFFIFKVGMELNFFHNGGLLG